MCAFHRTRATQSKFHPKWSSFDPPNKSRKFEFLPFSKLKILNSVNFHEQGHHGCVHLPLLYQPSKFHNFWASFTPSIQGPKFGENLFSKNPKKKRNRTVHCGGGRRPCSFSGEHRHRRSVWGLRLGSPEAWGGP